jgi:hypothetical protein
MYTTCCNIKKINFATLLVCALKVTAVTKLCSTDEMVFFITETGYVLGHMGTIRLYRTLIFS